MLFGSKAAVSLCSHWIGCSHKDGYPTRCDWKELSGTSHVHGAGCSPLHHGLGRLDDFLTLFQFRSACGRVCSCVNMHVNVGLCACLWNLCDKTVTSGWFSCSPLLTHLLALVEMWSGEVLVRNQQVSSAPHLHCPVLVNAHREYCHMSGFPCIMKRFRDSWHRYVKQLWIQTFYLPYKAQQSAPRLGWDCYRSLYLRSAKLISATVSYQETGFEGWKLCPDCAD